MALSFSEKRAQTRALRNIAFWLQPKSRCDIGGSNSMNVTLNEMEVLCDGPIRGAKFDADLFYDILKPAFDSAENFIVEYAATLGYRLTEYQLSSSYSPVIYMPGGDPGKELDLTLSVLQTIAMANESISKRTEIMERLENLIVIKANLETKEPDLPKIFPTIEERIEYCDGVTDEEIEEYLDQILEDERYQEKLSVFVDRGYLLKGVKPARVLQRAYQKVATMNKPFYDSLFSLMQSVVKRLSAEEFEEVFEASGDHFKAVVGLKREYVAELKDTINRDKEEGTHAFITHALLRGPKTASEELAKFLAADEKNNTEVCIKILRKIPVPLYKLLFDDTPPVMLMSLFSMRGSFAGSHFNSPMECIVVSNIFPLYKLLNVMNFPSHLLKIFNAKPIRKCIAEMDVGTTEWEETVQSIINCLSIVSIPTTGMKVTAIKEMLNLVKTKSGEDALGLLEWMSKYQNYNNVAQFIEIIPTPEVTTTESTSEENAVDDDEKKEEVKKCEDEAATVAEKEKKTKKGEEQKKELKGEKKKKETKIEKRMRKLKEQRESLREEEKKKLLAETEEKEEEKGKVPEVPAGDEKANEKEDEAESEKEPTAIELIDLTQDSDNEKEVIDLTGDSEDEKETKDHVTRRVQKGQKVESEHVACLGSLLSMMSCENTRNVDKNEEEKEESEKVPDIVALPYLPAVPAAAEEEAEAEADPRPFREVAVIPLGGEEEAADDDDGDGNSDYEESVEALAATQSSDDGFAKSTSGSTLNIDEI